MTTVAKFLLSEVEAIALVEAIEREEMLSALPVSRDDVGNRRWQVQIYLSGERVKAEVAALRLGVLIELIERPA